MFKSSSKVSNENKQGILFWPKLAQKWILVSEFQKSKPRSGISNSKIPCVGIFSQNGQLWIFGLNLGKLSNYMRYFGSNNVEGVAESKMEARMSWLEVDGAGSNWVELNGVDRGGWNWVEVGARFSNTVKFVLEFSMLANYKMPLIKITC